MASKVTEKISEAEKVYRHKREQFKRIVGDEFPEDLLEKLASSDIYYDDFTNLLNRGCPPEIAVKILL